MFLSQLILNERDRNAQRNLSAPYEAHRTVMRGFAHLGPGGPGRILFRVESADSRRPPNILVQSEKRPDWAFLAGSPQAIVLPVKEVNFVVLDQSRCEESDIVIAPGRRFRFCLVANPTVKREGKRHGLFQESDQINWLIRKATAAGFEIVSGTESQHKSVVVTPLGKSRSSKRSDGNTLTISHHGVRFDGILEVTRPAEFVAAVQAGIGSAKGFGYGLLSLARC